MLAWDKWSLLPNSVWEARVIGWMIPVTWSVGRVSGMGIVCENSNFCSSLTDFPQRKKNGSWHVICVNEWFLSRDLQRVYDWMNDSCCFSIQNWISLRLQDHSCKSCCEVQHCAFTIVKFCKSCFQTFRWVSYFFMVLTKWQHYIIKGTPFFQTIFSLTGSVEETPTFWKYDEQ